MPEDVEVVESPFAAEVGLVAVGDGEELEALELLVLEDGAPNGQKGVVEVVVDGLLVKADISEGGADLGVRGADQLEVVTGVHGELRSAGAGEGVVGEDVLRAVDRHEERVRKITVPSSARGEAGVLDGGEEVREKVGAVRRGVKAGEDLRGRAVGGGIDEVGGPGRERGGGGCGNGLGRDWAVMWGRRRGRRM